ncbi:MAG TPA: aminodeoxychorismate synthase component I [Edaphobacter sp.]|uniref:aminodeoxychorismate synthase component I n=1 Tax=Edaphobacter sp. TaxID=1934404 RepID=UPI002B8F0DE3|nr:aminodeoxychorismate synthase component I [Edaphobacter sp.]HUZ93812.1 aminodeoxychorismate synthase component I [Edaphobacter sp.]
MRILILDNYDSFTFNLVDMLAQLTGESPVVRHNDKITLAEIVHLAPEAIILSPGPGHPGHQRDFGVCAEVVRELRVPILGICLGHQGIVEHSGGSVVRASEPVHGRTSKIFHDGSALFDDIPQGFNAVRYHSLVIGEPLPTSIEVIAWTSDNIPMALRRRDAPFWGVQFHPESICTDYGTRILGNFLNLACGFHPRKASESRTDTTRKSATPKRKVLHRQLDFFVAPETAYASLYAQDDFSIWLDSSRAEPGISRYSFIAGSSTAGSFFVEYRTAGQRLVVHHDGQRTECSRLLTEYLNETIAAHSASPAEVDCGFQCGFAGYFGYELKAEFGASAAHRSELPDAVLLFASAVIAFDHQDRVIHLFALDMHPEASKWFEQTERALAHLDPLLSPETIEVPNSFRLARGHCAHMADIQSCISEIRAGESYEICLTNRLEAASIAEPFDFYRTLRRVNPAPYSAFLRHRHFSVACSSPEQFLRVDRHGWISSKPIKGTAARMTDADEDRQALEQLATSVKNRAENLMIVDLIRNDLSRVSRPGSVSVPNLMYVQTLATVHQLVSTIQGHLRPELTAVDCIAACFPGGSMTGAPKFRAMEIIDRLENAPRGIYSGSIGYLSVDGAADLNIVIRTAVITPEHTTIGAGGAITILSNREEEFDEMVLKTVPLMKAIAIAGGQEFTLDQSRSECV